MPTADLLEEMLPGVRPQTFVRREGTCLLWLGQTNVNGYAVVVSGRKHVLLHRLIFEVAKRPLRAGEVVRHAVRCPNRNCIEPLHLTAGTQADNMADMRQRVALGLPSNTPARKTEFRARQRDAIARSIPYVEPELPTEAR